LFFIIATTSFAQTKANFGYMNGVIHLKNGDSIVGYIEKQVAYGQNLAYKIIENGKTEEIPVWQVNYFKAGNKTLTSIPLNNAAMLMEVIDTGKVGLYEFSEIKYRPAKYDRNTGLKTTNGDIIIHYVLKHPTAIQDIKETDFKAVLKQLFSDCERMVGKILRGDYLFEDMPQIVKEYNNCKGQYCTHSSVEGNEH
jgi:hypothetical protein